MSNYIVSGYQLKRIAVLLLDIKENYHTKNEIDKILWDVTEHPYIGD